MDSADRDGLVLVHGPAEIKSKQGLPYFVGISGHNAGARGISMNMVVIPAGGAGEPHCHSNFESTIYLVKGRVLTKYGDGLAQSAIVEAGDFLYIGPNVWHQPINLSETEEAIAIVARNDPEEQEHVILYDDQIRGAA
ncbi:MAG: cupin domain-containing protein [Chloroflexota bacterium]|nr:MAG: cupin domain-containing protein [Chloroflexota bacterium]